MAEGKDKLSNFFKSSNFNTNPENLTFNGLRFERMYFDFYSQLINEYKNNVALEIPQSRSLKECSWEPLLKSTYQGMLLFLKEFFNSVNKSTESAILMDLFKILNISGYGNYDLGLPVKGSIMTISARNHIETYTDMQLGVDPDKTLSVFTGGIVLACYDLAMSSTPVETIFWDNTFDMYDKSPDIVQVNSGGSDQDINFAFFIR